MGSFSTAIGERDISSILHFQILRSAVNKQFTRQSLVRFGVIFFVLSYFAAHFYYFFIYNDFSFFVRTCLNSFEINLAYFYDIIYIIKSEYSYYAVAVILIFPIILVLIGLTVIADYRRYRSQINFIETKAREIA